MIDAALDSLHALSRPLTLGKLGSFLSAYKHATRTLPKMPSPAEEAQMLVTFAMRDASIRERDVRAQVREQAAGEPTLTGS